jgi:hypothetical protein
MAMKKILIASAVAALSCSIPALAAGPLGGVAAGVGVDANVNADVNVGRRGASAGAAENANGNVAAEREHGRARARDRDRDRDRDRAEGRMSEQGRSHERASTAPHKKRGEQHSESPRAGVSASGNLGAEGAASGR